MERLSPTIVKANLLLQAGQVLEMRALLQAHLRRQPRDHHGVRLLALAHALNGEVDQAVFLAQRALELAPDDAPTAARAASVMGVVGRTAEAVTLYRKALGLNPDDLDALEGLAMLLVMEQAYEDARPLVERALELQPGDGTFTVLLSATRQSLGHGPEALAMLDGALAENPDDEELLYARASALNYVSSADPAEIAAAHRRYGQRKLASTGEPLPPAPPRKPGPLRIGLVSPDFRAHSVAYFVEPLLRELDRARFTPVGFSTNGAKDAMTSRLRPLLAEWHEMFWLNDRRGAELVRARDIDILIDLCGLTSGERLGMFALRPARVHATYLGYPNTTGLPAMDVRFVDAMTDPEGFESRCTERLIRLDGCFVCYGPSGQIAPEPRERDLTGGVTFASFNVLSKMNDEVIEKWVEIVNGVPGSRLLLKAAVLKSESARADLGSRFERAGLAPDRLEMLGWVASNPMLLYERVDIALDPFPYNGTTTTSEALWMGVPVVTLEGNTHAGRVGVSLLGHAGIPELVARSPAEYVRIATALATDPRRLGEYRRTLRARVASTIADGAAFARRFERALEQIAPR